MNEFSTDAFDFDKMNEAIGSNPFDNDKKSYTDERFYKLDKDKNSNGQAIIALVPDKNKHFIIKMYKIETTLEKNGSKQWINEWSPKSIGKACPFQETYINHYNEDKNIAKQFKPKEKWICNIKVIKDPMHPENEGKIFLYAFSKTMAQKIQDVLTLTDAEIAMGMQRKEIFNPLKGWVMNLKCYKADTGFISYDNSDFMQLPNGNTIYGPLNDEAKQKCYDDIVNNTYSLSDLQKPENFLSYDDLYKELERICRGTFGIGSKAAKETNEVKIEETSEKVETVEAKPEIDVKVEQETPKPEVNSTPKQSDDLADFLAKL